MKLILVTMKKVTDLSFPQCDVHSSEVEFGKHKEI